MNTQIETKTHITQADAKIIVKGLRLLRKTKATRQMDKLAISSLGQIINLLGCIGIANAPAIRYGVGQSCTGVKAEAEHATVWLASDDWGYQLHGVSNMGIAHVQIGSVEILHHELMVRAFDLITEYQLIAAA